MVTPRTSPDPSPVVDARAARRTTRALRAACRRGQVLGVVDAHGVDLVLTSHGPLALHPVWLDDAPDPADPAGAAALVDLARAARGSAGRGDAALLASGVRHRAVPVLVAWGRARALAPRGGRLLHDVLVLRGSELGSWLHHDVTRGTTWTALDAAAALARLDALHHHAARPLAG